MNTGSVFVFGLVFLLANVVICKAGGEAKKPGKCPPERCIDPSRWIATYKQCENDSGCTGNDKCCPDNGYLLCKPSVDGKTKKPQPPKRTSKNCNDFCSSDNECPKGATCCMGPTGMTCTPCKKPNKPGFCREKPPKCLVDERPGCDTDCNCPDDKKCCPESCHTTCQTPVWY